MSVSSLTYDDPDKSWSNLYVNSVTVYNDLDVRGNITGTTNYEGDVTIKGKLILDNTNNNDVNAIEITGGKTLLSDGVIRTTNELEVGTAAYVHDFRATGFSTIHDVHCNNITSTGSSDLRDVTCSSLTSESQVLVEENLQYQANATDIQRVIGNISHTYTCPPYVVTAASQSLTIRAVEYGNLIHFDLLYDGGLNAVANEPLEWSYPVNMPVKYIPTHNTNHPIFIISGSGIGFGVFSFNNTNGTFMVRRFNNNTFESFVSGQPAELAGTQSISFHKN